MTMCNPPFHSSLANAQAGMQRKWQQLAQGRSSHKNLKTSTFNYKNLGLGRQIDDLICLFWSRPPWKEKQSMILLGN